MSAPIHTQIQQVAHMQVQKQAQQPLQISGNTSVIYTMRNTFELVLKEARSKWLYIKTNSCHKDSTTTKIRGIGCLIPLALTLSMYRIVQIRRYMEKLSPKHSEYTQYRKKIISNSTGHKNAGTLALKGGRTCITGLAWPFGYCGAT